MGPTAAGGQEVGRVPGGLARVLARAARPAVAVPAVDAGGSRAVPPAAVAGAPVGRAATVRPPGAPGPDARGAGGESAPFAAAAGGERMPVAPPTATETVQPAPSEAVRSAERSAATARPASTGEARRPPGVDTAVTPQPAPTSRPARRPAAGSPAAFDPDLPPEPVPLAAPGDLVPPAPTTGPPQADLVETGARTGIPEAAATSPAWPVPRVERVSPSGPDRPASAGPGEAPSSAPPVVIGRIEVHVEPPAAQTDPFAGCRVVAGGLTARRGGGW
ncbi:MAG TPA: hypothetical protein VFI44_07965 [Ornithinibacter sp.]|nr:hypothetical protein [Ornithinibacter sp.]